MLDADNEVLRWLARMNVSCCEIWMGQRGQRLTATEPRAVTLQPSARGTEIVVEFADGTTHAFVPDWLRDQCLCDDCHIRQTDERRWQPWIDPSPPTVAHAGVNESVLTVAWTSGHTSTFSAATFAAIDRASHRGGHPVRLWSGGYTIDRFDHDESVTDLAVRRELFESFRRDGAVVVTNAPTEPGSVISFLRAVGITLRDSSLGLIFDVTFDPVGYNVAFTSETVPPHNDNAQYAHPPSGQVLAMLANDAPGGDSIIVDGWSVVDQLNRTDPAAVDVLARVDVGHRQYSADVEAFTRAPLVVRDAHGQCVQLRFSNQLMQPLPHDHPDLDQWYRAFRLLGSAVTDPGNQVTFRLTAGDMLMVNGYRVLHARTAYEPIGRRHLQDVYFDVDDVFGQLARMSGEAPVEMVAARH